MRILTLVLTAFVLALGTGASAATTVTVPGATPMKIRLIDTISSSNANVGDTFQFRADSDVVVNGWIVVAKGAPGQGEVISVDRAGSHGHAGNLGLKFDYIYSVDGKKIRLTATNKKQEGDQRGGASSTATVTSTLLLGPVGLFAHNWVKGRDVTIDNTRSLDAYVDSTVHIVAKSRGLDPNAGYAH
jgi:hypothetical protein